MSAAIKLFINEKDILNKLSDDDRKKYNKCVFHEAKTNSDGSELTFVCLLFNDNDNNDEQLKED